MFLCKSLNPSYTIYSVKLIMIEGRDYRIYYDRWKKLKIEYASWQLYKVKLIRKLKQFEENKLMLYEGWFQDNQLVTMVG